jgi:hypothetical protein
MSVAMTHSEPDLRLMLEARWHLAPPPPPFADSDHQSDATTIAGDDDDDEDLEEL